MIDTRLSRGVRRRAPRSTPYFHAVMTLLVWTAWFLWGGQRAVQALETHWPVSLTMAFGSLIAGATSEGGGAVAFPIFTKVLAIAPSDARIFSLAIQSVGMTAASLLILFMRIRVSWRAILCASLAGIPGIALSSFWLSPLVSPVVVRISFTLMLASFAVTLWLLNRVDRATHSDLSLFGGREVMLLALAGLLGGIMSGLVGNGIDIVTFALLVLLFRVSEKVATPTSVILMAGNSLVGFGLHLFVLDDFTPQIQAWWLAAVPIVVVGAPVGAMLCGWMTRHHIAWLLIFLILVEFVTSLILIPLSADLLMWAAGALVLLAGVDYALYRSSRYLPTHVGR